MGKRQRETERFANVNGTMELLGKGKDRVM